LLAGKFMPGDIINIELAGEADDARLIFKKAE